MIDFSACGLCFCLYSLCLSCPHALSCSFLKVFDLFLKRGNHSLIFFNDFLLRGMMEVMSRANVIVGVGLYTLSHKRRWGTLTSA